jgi:hypothetical protein
MWGLIRMIAYLLRRRRRSTRAGWIWRARGGRVKREVLPFWDFEMVSCGIARLGWREVSFRERRDVAYEDRVYEWEVRCDRGRDGMECDGCCDEVFVLVLHGQEPGGFSNAKD